MLCNRKRLLLIAETFRLPYRVLRCAAAGDTEVIVLGASGAARLNSSRLCKTYVKLDGSFADNDAWTVQQIDAICDQWRIDFVVPSCPVTTRFLALHGPALKTRHFPVPSVADYDLVNDKWRFAALCGELGIPTPASRCVRSARDLDGTDLAFPIIVKPLDRWGSSGVQKFRTKADIQELAYSPILAQEYVAGDDLSAFFLCRAGTVVSTIQYMRRDERVTFLRDEAFERHARALIRHLAFDGVIGFDARRDARGNITLIECNPRFWYRIDLALLVGKNFVLHGLFPEPLEAKDAVKAINLGVLAHSSLLRYLLTPWRLNRLDRALLKCLAADPMPSLWNVVHRATGFDFEATGLQF